MNLSLPNLEVHMVVVTPYRTIENITPNKKYIITRIDYDTIHLVNDIGVSCKYKGIYFLEAEIYFSLCLYMTFVRILEISNLPLKTL
jgi:hypothetical protein